MLKFSNSMGLLSCFKFRITLKYPSLFSQVNKDDIKSSSSFMQGSSSDIIGLSVLVILDIMANNLC